MDRPLPVLLLLVGCLLAPALPGYESNPPEFIEVEVTWRDAASGQPKTVAGHLYFADMPVLDPHREGMVRGFGSRGYMEGVKWFVPLRPGDIWLARTAAHMDPAVTDPTTPEGQDPHTFILKDYLETAPITLAFDHLEVGRTDESKSLEHLKETVTRLEQVAPRPPGGHGEIDKNLEQEFEDLTGEKANTEEDLTVNQATGERLAWMNEVTAEDLKGKRSPLLFATDEPLDLKTIPVADLLKIVFLRGGKGVKREMYTGRYVQYSNEAKGDNGTVAVAAATFFGGAAEDERFQHGDFFADTSILMGANLFALEFVDPAKVTVLGTDPAADAYPAKEVPSKRNRTRIVHPRRSPVLVHYSPDLRELIGVTRLAWGVGEVHKFAVGPDDAVYVSGMVGPHFDAFAQEVGVTATVENPEAVKASTTPDQKGRTRPLGPDGYVAKLKPGMREVDWVVRFKHGGEDIYLRPDGKLLARRQDTLFFITPDGRVEDGPKLEITGGHMTVCPKTGDMYFGGSYRSGTGREPWVSPYLYKVAADGTIAWSAYAWSGPVVGTQQFRQVSDSAVTRVSVGEGGQVSFIGWSDGGNTVFCNQPYDMRQGVKSSGWCSSTWGATGGLTVRIANIVQLQADTMEATGRTQYVAYLPTSDVPTLLNLYSMVTMPNGDIAVSGACSKGFVETHDAWLTSWYREFRTNPNADAKGGTFFTLFGPGFGPPRMASRTPGVGGPMLAGKGKQLILFGTAGVGPEDAVHDRFRRVDPAIIKHAVQGTKGAGMDAYVMLIDTHAESSPPAIPDWTWESEAVKRKRIDDEKNRRKDEHREIRP